MSPVTLIQLFVASIYILSLGIRYQICSCAYSSFVSSLQIKSAASKAN